MGVVFMVVNIICRGFVIAKLLRVFRGVLMKVKY